MRVIKRLLLTLIFYEAGMEEMVGMEHQDPGDSLGGKERRG